MKGSLNYFSEGIYKSSTNRNDLVPFSITNRKLRSIEFDSNGIDRKGGTVTH